jgi:diphthine synthase
MTLNLIGLGMNANSTTAEALKAIKSSDKVYLENYTVNFPYKIEDLKIKTTPLNREQVENESIIEEAKTKNISLLVYGDALSATTHIQLILAAKKQNIPYKIFHNASILTTIAETGLSLYKFGKTTSMPNWKEHTNKPTSFKDIIKQNQSINAHTLILTDIGLEIKEAVTQLKLSTNNLPKKIIAISNVGTKNQKTIYNTLKEIQNSKIKMPFCLIIPAKLNHIEEEILKTL